MNDAVKIMLDNYHCQSNQDYLNALKEIFQEIALLGLWRANFFEKAAFYGGSALRILYGLDRFSEDLDFSLLVPQKNFDLTAYNTAIVKELAAFGFDASMQNKIKSKQSNIESAFIKANSKMQLLSIEAPDNIIKTTHDKQIIKIKMEVDINPPGSFTTENKYLLLPMPFSVKTFTETNLFAGKIHAILCRPWVARVKGRDWYDFIWYIARGIAVNLTHLQERMIQTNSWSSKEQLTREQLIKLLKTKISETDFEQAKQDISIFIADQSKINLWSKEFFSTILDKLKTEN